MRFGGGTVPYGPVVMANRLSILYLGQGKVRILPTPVPPSPFGGTSFRLVRPKRVLHQEKRADSHQTSPIPALMGELGYRSSRLIRK